MKNALLLLLLFWAGLSWSQKMPEKVNDQKRYKSDSRMFYVWNQDKDAYDLRDTEFENSIIDIREIGSRSNGYIMIALTDDGKVRTYHGSIIQFNVDDEGNSTWVMRSKNARGKLVLEPKKKTLTYSYESNETRYVKIFIFNLAAEDEERDN
ncbi:hypothetical protein [Flavobacterium caeni]|uniref:Lipocalin-like domain-containing protein n=1 Tax=Flavobacterium caeni TaxID=490189 RepID=A0A1G5IX07_9FLAO|nr:hypothetical protein [Flavobacterium caeni]SCY80602.1 hypothetical protein SAMN02927903_02448 [Flavobacterium caeni]